MQRNETSPTRRSSHVGRRLLLVLIAVLVTGFPHMAAAWSDGSIYDEDHTLRSVRRVLLLDKATSGRFTLAPHATRPDSGSPVRLPAPVTHHRRAVRAAVHALPKPRPWLRSMIRALYRRHSNFT